MFYPRRVGVSISCRNAAFEEGCAEEVVRILRDLAERIERDGIDTTQPPRQGERYSLRDSNGNAVGQCHIS